ncbi:MAG: ribosome maturation factor RimP [Turneriella sp.]
MNLPELREKQIRERVLATLPAELSLHKLTFFHSRGNMRIVIELDKLSDPYGSVNIGECESYSRALRSALDELEKETAIDLNYSLEVSSAGAERELTSISEVQRFSALPLQATFDSAGKTLTEILRISKIDGTTLECALADCKANRKKFGPAKLRKQTPFTIDWHNVKKIRLHLDI